MRPNLQPRSKFIAALAFLQRLFERAIGAHENRRFGVAIAERSERYLMLLNRDEGHLTFRIALEHLRREYDLFFEESALVPAGLQLQRKLVDLAERYEIADQLVNKMFVEPPIARLFNAVVAEGAKQKASRIRIEFEPNRRGLPVQMLTEQGWSEYMLLPYNLGEAFRGVIARVEGIGYAELYAYMGQPPEMPTYVSFHRNDPQHLEIELGPLQDQEKEAG